MDFAIVIFSRTNRTARKYQGNEKWAFDLHGRQIFSLAKRDVTASCGANGE
jgi:hypothetical protein